MKYILYTNLFKQLSSSASKLLKKNIMFLLNKKKSSFIFTLLFNKKLLISISIGTMLKFLKVDSRSIKKTKKGFLAYVSLVKKIFLKFSNKHYAKNVFINFFDFYLLYFYKKFKFIFEKKARVFFNLNLNTKQKYFKKVKGIKKRLLKKKLKIFLQDWKILKNNKVSTIQKFKIT